VVAKLCQPKNINGKSCTLLGNPEKPKKNNGKKVNQIPAE
jgi:hypothetical protein